MLKLRVVALVVVLTLLVSVTGVFAQDQNIVEAASGNEDFSTLVSLVTAADLVDTLSGEGPFTVFAPTNEAFAELPEPVVAYLNSHTDLLASILTYHVVAEAVTPAESGTLVSVNGAEITVTVDGMGIAINQAHVVETVEASNGLIHVIDAVILPAIELPEVVPAFVEGDVISAGSSTVYPLSDAIATRFKNEGYTGSVTVDSIGSGAGFERFCSEGASDISNASRAIKDSEIENCKAINRTPIEFRVGTDALSVVINPANDWATSMTKEQLALAFSTADTWQDIDPSWPAEPIERFIPGTDSGTFDYFVEDIFDKDEAPILAAARTSLSEDDNVLVTGVEGNPYAIAFFGYSYFAANSDRLTAVAVEGIAPNAETVNAAEYPLARPLFIYSDATIMAEKPQVADFIGYYLTVVNEEIGPVGYFPADPFSLNLAKLSWLAGTGGAM